MERVRRYENRGENMNNDRQRGYERGRQSTRRQRTGNGFSSYKGPGDTSRGSDFASEDEGLDGASDVLVGRHPVREALRAERSISRIWVQEGANEGSLGEIKGLARTRGVPVHSLPRIRLDEVAGRLPHQGIVAFVAVRPLLSLEDVEELVKASDEPLVLILDGIQDPHNVGAILRVANAVAATAVIIPSRGAAGLTPTVAKASAGAVEYVSVASVINIAQAISRLKQLGLFIYAADPTAPVLYHQVNWNGSIGLVIGSEGSGLRPLVRERCDGLVRLPMLGQVASLNAAAATAVVAFEVLRQRQNPKKP